MRRESVEARYLELKSDSTGRVKGRWVLFRDAEGNEVARFGLDDVLGMSRVV